MKRAGMQCLAALCTTVAACTAQVPSEPFDVRIRVTTEAGPPVPNATVTLGGTNRGTTDGTGTAAFVVQGFPGTAVPVTIGCPAGFDEAGPTPPLRLIRARSLGDSKAARPLEITAECHARRRDIALVVHAPLEPGLPVWVDGMAVATTDARGNAHVLLRRNAETARIAVSLNTQAHTRLRPKNPNRTFELADSGDLLFFAPRMSRNAAPRRRPPKPKARIRPYRVD